MESVSGAMTNSANQRPAMKDERGGSCGGAEAGREAPGSEGASAKRRTTGRINVQFHTDNLNFFVPRQLFLRDHDQCKRMSQQRRRLH
jgi:hypothetical protein